MVNKILNIIAYTVMCVFGVGALIFAGSIVYGIGVLNVLSAVGQSLIAPAILFLMFWAVHRIEKIKQNKQ